MSAQATATAPVRHRVVEIMNALMPDGDFVPAEQAEKIVAYMEESEPQLLADWQTECVRQFFHDELSRVVRSQRARWRRGTNQRGFAAAVQAFDAGDTEALSAFVGGFEQRFRVNNDNVQRPVRDMTGADHSFVASSYQRSGSRHLMLAAFHRQVGKVVGNKKTAEVMTEEQYVRLYDSITKQMAS